MVEMANNGGLDMETDGEKGGSRVTQPLFCQGGGGKEQNWVTPEATWIRVATATVGEIHTCWSEDDMDVLRADSKEI